MLLENIDCLAHVLSFLSVREREICRLVCHKWRTSADELARIQQSLTVIGQKDRRKYNNSPSTNAQVHQRNRFSSIFSLASNPNSSIEHGETIYWPHNFIRYQCYCLMLGRFPNLRSIRFEGIDHWNDHLIHELTSNCPSLQSIAFVRCIGLGRSRMNETDYLNVTFNGWNCLIQQYGRQITTLILQDCDLDDRQLNIIVNGFRQLQYLDISSNRIVEATALNHICNTIRVLKVGPRLIGNNVSADIPIQPIVSGSARFVSELYLQGFLNANLSLVATMPNLTKLVIRFMKPLFEDANISNCFSAIGKIRTLQCLEIYQHNTHDCYMALSKEHLLSIFNGCNFLERFVLNCDIWCDSPLDDQIIAQLRRSCPQLRHLDLCPGNFQTTDQCLQYLSTFPMLHYLRIVEFSGITENGLLSMVRRMPYLSEVFVEDCCDINTASFVRALKCLHHENPNRTLNIAITPLRSLQIPTEMIEMPRCNPRFRITIFGQKDRNKYFNSDNFEANKMLSGHYGTAYHSVSSLLSMLLEASVSVFTFLSTLLTFGAACFFYLFHFVLISVNNRFAVQRHSLGIPFLTTSVFLFLFALFAAPFLYLVSRLIYVFPVQTTLSGQLIRIDSDT